MSVDPALRRRLSWKLFLAAWLAYGFFHQGGGWNQNARFAMLRAVVEERRLAVDDFLVYEVDAGATADTVVFSRVPIERGELVVDGERRVLAWPGSPPEPVRADTGLRPAAVHRIAVSGDLAFARDRFHPNKAPGTALLAVPAYAALHAIERELGIDPDDWWVLTVNAWLTTALSVGLVAAMGVVVFFHAALLFAGGSVRAAVAATLGFAFGTIYFPYATMLFEHDVVAVALLGGFALLAPAAMAGRAPPAARLVLAGVILGWSAISTYVAVVPIAMIGAWCALRARRAGLLAWIGLGIAVPFAVIVLHNAAAFGTPFTTNYSFQSEQFRDAEAFLGVLERPSFEAFVGVLVSPYRGLFFSAPVLLAGVAGLVAFARSEQRPEAALFAGIAGFFLLFNVSFNGWHGGSGVGPRYLIPALPFLALPSTWAFARWPRACGALAAVSIGTMLAFTAVDPQWPPFATERSRLLREPLGEYVLPILMSGRAQPVIDAQLEALAAEAEQDLLDAGLDTGARARRLAEYRDETRALAERGDARMPVSLIRGPVSANPMGFYEGWFGQLRQPPAPELGWNSFNAGELLLPERRASLLLLLAGVAPLVVSALRSACSTGS